MKITDILPSTYKTSRMLEVTTKQMALMDIRCRPKHKQKRLAQDCDLLGL